MFGEMNVVPIIDLRRMPEEVGGSVDGAMTRLLDVTEHPTITKWVQLPKALLVFLLVPGDPESGAFYVYDRGSRVWLWVDFDDEKFGGYSVEDFDRLVRECRFLDIVEHPQMLSSKNRWTIQPGCRPSQTAAIEQSDLEKKLA
jgi:hypothetical protein